jgi:hypothetical protein
MSKARLLKDLGDYLLLWLNTRAEEEELEKLDDVLTGQTATLGTAPVTPTLFLALPSRAVEDKDFTIYHAQLGIVFPAPTPSQAEEWGDKWEDILEDLIRVNCELGGLGHIASSDAIESAYSPAMGFVTVEFEVEVDRYAEEA